MVAFIALNSAFIGADADNPNFKEPDFAFPRTVIEEAQQKLIQADNLPDFEAGVLRLRAAIEICSAEQMIDQDNIFKQPDFVESIIAKSAGNNAAVAMLTLYEAKLFCNIYGINCYKYNSVEAPLEPYPDDISEWSGAQFHSEITDLLAKARSVADSTPLEQFATSVDWTPEALQYMPTIADFARYCSYSSLELLDDYNFGKVSTELKELNRALFSSNIDAYTPGTPQYFFWCVRDFEANCDNEDLLFKTLIDFYLKWENCEAARYVLMVASDYYDGDIFDDLEDTTSFVDILSRSLAKFGSWYNNNVFKDEINRLTQPKVIYTVDDAVALGSSFDISVKYAYVKELEVCIYQKPIIDSRISPSEIVKSQPCLVSQKTVVDSICGELVLPFTLSIPGEYIALVKLDGELDDDDYADFQVLPVNLFSISHGESAYASVVDFYTGKPIKNDLVELVYKQNRRWNEEIDTLGRTNSDGVVPFNISRAGYLQVQHDGKRYSFDKDITVVNFNKSEDVGTYCEVTILTDRPLYHPGDTVNWAFVMAKSDGNFQRVVEGLDLLVSLYDANNELVDSLNVKTDQFGRASGAFSTKTDVLTGQWYIKVYDEDEIIRGRNSFMVSDFKLPQIEAEITSLVRQSDSVTVKGIVKTYSGMPVAGADVDITVNAVDKLWWRSRRYVVADTKVKTDDDGCFTINLTRSQLYRNVDDGDNPNFELDINITSPTSETTSLSYTFAFGKPYGIGVDIAAVINSDKPFVFTPMAYDANSQAKSIQLRWCIVDNDSQHPLASGDALAGQAVSADISKLKSGTYSVVIAPVDSTLADEYRVDNVQFYSIKHNTLPDDVDPLFVPETDIVRIGNEAIFYVGANCARLYVYSFLCHDETLENPELIKIDRGFKKIKVKLPAGSKDCNIKLIAAYHGKIHHSDVKIKKQISEKYEIIAESFRDKLIPGNNEVWRFRLAKAGDVATDVAMIASMYNHAIDALSSKYWPATIISPIRYNSYVRFDYHRFGYSRASSEVAIHELETIDLIWPYFRYGDYIHRGAMKLRMSMAASNRHYLAECEEEEDMTIGASVTEECESESVPEVEYRDSEVLQAFWMPNLVADFEGNIDLVFTVPNANATWNFVALAWNKAAEAAGYQNRVLTNKPIMVQPNLPRFLRQGDSATILATVYNNSEDAAEVKSVVEIFDIASGKILKTVESVDSLAVNASAIVSIDVEAPATAEAIGYRVRSISGSFSDGEQTAIPVLPSVATVIESTEFYLNPRETKPFELVIDPKNDTQITLQYCQNPIWTVVKAMRGISATEALTSTGISSHLFSALAAKYIVDNNRDIADAIAEWKRNPSDDALTSMLSRNKNLKKLMLEQTPWIQAAKSESARMATLTQLLDPEMVDKAIADMLADLSKLQNADGGFAWSSWCDSSSRWATESILTTFGIARSLGLLPSNYNEMLAKAFKYLCDNAVADKQTTDSDIALIASYFPDFERNTKVERLIANTVSSIAKSWKSLSTIDKAYSIQILMANNRSDVAKQIMASIRQFAVERPGMGLCFPNVSDMRCYGTIIQAYNLMGATTSEIDALRQWVIIQAQANDDLGAFNPDYIISSLLLTGTDWTGVKADNYVTVNGMPLEITKQDIAMGYFAQNIDTNDNQVVISVRPNGVTPSYGSVISIGTALAKSVEARPGKDLSIEKRFLVNRDGEWVETDFLNLGERVRVQLIIKAKRNLEYVSIDDERAATFEPVDQLPGFVWDGSLGFYRENLDASTRLFIGYLPIGTYHVTYDMVAAVAGSYISGIASLQSQYAPELTAHSAGTIVVVK